MTKLRQLRQNTGDGELVALASEMQQKGQSGLKVEKERLNVKSLKFLSDFRHIESLAIYGVAKDISTIGSLSNLKSLSICQISTSNLDFLQSLPKLEELWIQGVKLKDWSALSRINTVKRLTLFNLRLDDYGFLSEMLGLQIIHFINCGSLVSLPSMAQLTSLRRVVLDTVNKLESFSGALDSPTIIDICLIEAKKISSEAFECLIQDHPSFRKILVGHAATNSKRYKEVIATLPDEILMDGWYGTPNEHFEIN